MAIIISHQIRKKEFKRGIIPAKDLETIIDGYKKGIFVSIKGEGLPKASKLIKIYATTVSGARRIVYLVDMVNDDAFFLFYRKKDDKIGENVSIKNPVFRQALNEYLVSLNEDIDAGEMDVYQI